MQKQRKNLFKLLSTALMVSALGFCSASVAYDGEPMALSASEKPKEFEGIGIKENLSQKLDLDMVLTNEAGEKVPLRSFYDGKHPVIISLIYFSCPGLCNFHLNGVVEGLKELEWSAGNQYQILAISFDSKETHDVAGKKKASYVKLYDRPGTEKGFHFLTADEATVQKITQQIGFSFKWNAEANEWAHASAAVFTTPAGVISRYLHGIMFEPKNLKLAINEAAEGKIGTVIDQLMWYCFRYDPKASKYTLAAFRLVQIGGTIFVILLALFLIPFWIRSRKQNREKTG